MVITLTTDFGHSDGYVGIMKGVMATIAPSVPVIDITHSIGSQAVAEAAYVLWTSLPYFPPGSVHLVVVDPGVGTARRAIASRTAWGVLVGPDNGVFSYVWAEAPPDLTVALENRQYRRGQVSSTFHGRDIFAPAAAHIAAGVPLECLGPVVADAELLPLPLVEISPGRIRGRILHIDRFGNAVTSIGRLSWTASDLDLVPAFGPHGPVGLAPAEVMISVRGRTLGQIHRTYGDVARGDPIALIGSEGMLEIALNRGHAAEALGLAVGDDVLLTVTNLKGADNGGR